ncbi:glutamate receptor 2.7-like [Ziziphus jujuba]|uniref:Glutamate receptor 2.7-like n=1 Tax=Ziziphus jujuba TaxID=326968 RepID=A0ABM3IG21_ZIZJJ|nr:glutamate receptor 2.7-like [Ziziphus jujuba]
MHGVVGVRPYLPNSKCLQDFKNKWNKTSGDINLFGSWAYDTVWALAMAAKSLNPTALESHNSSINSIEPFGIRVSESGPQLLQKLLQTKFEGLSGEFDLIKGQLKPTDYEIINVRGKLGERVIGNWSLENGIPHGLDKSMKIVRKPIIWPGNTKVPPKGWVKPVFGTRLRIGVPITPAGFKEFLKIEWDPHTNEPSFSGFSYDIFLAVLDKLPFALPHKFIPFTNSSRHNNGTYDELLYQIKLKKFDAVVGDTTIVANRTKYVDFTSPYTESGVSMLPAISDIDKLKRNDHFVGYLKNSYVKELLTQQFNFSESKLRSYKSSEEYNDAMSKGSNDGGIDAIFEEIPYVKVFLSKYCSKYRVVGPTYKSAGFGFAFQMGSPLVSYISKAILNITQDPKKMQELESKYLEHGAKCEDPDSKFSSDDDPCLSVYSFSGLFIISGTVSIFSYLTHLIKLCCNRPSAMKVIHPDSSLCLWFVVTKREKSFHMDVPNNLHARADVSVNNNGDHLQNSPTAFN